MRLFCWGEGPAIASLQLQQLHVNDGLALAVTTSACLQASLRPTLSPFS
jgi:hypothetical protein